MNCLKCAGLYLTLFLYVMAGTINAQTLTKPSIDVGTDLVKPESLIPGLQKFDKIKLPSDGRSCPSSALEADVVAIDHPMLFNRLGAQNVNWMMYALRHDIIDIRNNKTLDYTPAGEKLFADIKKRRASRDVALRPDLRPRPLVLRVAEGGYLKVRFTNLLHSNPNPYPYPDPLPGIDHPTEEAAVPKIPPAANNEYRSDDQVASRTVGFHPQGLEVVSINDDSSYVGVNANSMVAPGQTKTYCFYAPEEGAFLVSNTGAVFGGEGTSGNSGVGLFGAVTVQPKGARFYRAQVTEEEMRLATKGKTSNDQPIINYEAVYECKGPVSECGWAKEGKVGKPILNMVQNNRIIHGDINALIIGPNKDGSFPKKTYPLESRGVQNPTLPNRLEPFREFVSVFHDENEATQAFPYFFEHPELKHTLHGVRDAFMINYGSGGIGAEIIANRLKAGPMQDCLDCAYEEFFLSSFAVGDAAMLVDKPANLIISQCQPEFVAKVKIPDPDNPGEEIEVLDPQYETERGTFCVQPPDQKATEVYYPHDPANVHHSYIGDFVKFRNLHSGKEQHIFHLHNHQWLFNPNDDNSNYIDAQGIGPGSGYTYEIAFGGSGNRNKTVGDAIFHCHFYPHFAQGMWYMWRIHDVFESGTRLEVTGPGKENYHKYAFDLKSGKPASGARALPDGEIVAGTPIPAVVPLPGKALAPMPELVHVTAKANGMGSKAELVNPFQEKTTKNPGYPFWIAGVTEHGNYQASIGSRPTTPPLDMTSIPGVVDGWDGGLPRHALSGYADGGVAMSELNRFTAEKHLKKAKPVYYPEGGTDLEQLAMRFHAQPSHVSHRINMLGFVEAASFETNGAPPVPGAPFNDPCIDDFRRYDKYGKDLLETGSRLLKKGENGYFFGGKPGKYVEVNDSLPNGIEFGADNPRVYKGANLQLDVVFNKIGYHYPQQRILTLWEDVSALMDKTRPPEPLVMRLNTFDCAMYAHTNLVPKDFYADDYQITTPTDVIGQHIHLPKWDLTSADGGANGWNYEDGTFSPGAVRERIHAINQWNADPGNVAVPNPYDGSNEPLRPELHPYFNANHIPNHQENNCVERWEEVDGEAHEFDLAHGMPGVCDWLGARTTLQRWFSDPIVNKGHVHRGLGITFTHDHLGPSTHQQLGLYATMLTEPPGSEWRHNETGTLLYDISSREDGGPTSWQAVITGKDGKKIDVDGDDYDDSHREFFLQFGDFQHAYVRGAYYGVNKAGIGWPLHPAEEGKPNENSFREAIHPSVRKPANPAFPDIIAYEPTCPGGEKGISGAVYNPASGRPPRPCPEAISADDVGMMVVNYRNEPIGARAYDENNPGTDGKSGRQTPDLEGDLAYAMQTRTGRAIGELNTKYGESISPPFSYTPLTQNVFEGDPFTPIMRAYSGDLVRVKIQAGSHEHEHNGSINAMNWMQAGSGYGQAPHSGWRNSQNTGLSEQFTLSARITDYWDDMYLNDRMYTLDSSQDGMWNGVWGVLRSKKTREIGDQLVSLPGNPVPTVLTPNQGIGSDNVCPADAKIRTYDVAAVLANEALGHPIGVTIPDRLNPGAPVDSSNLDPDGGTLVYNPRATTISINIDGKERTFGTGPLHDPTAILFVRKSDLDANRKLKPGAPIEPIVLRAAAGDCIQVKLHNYLPEKRDSMPDLDGYTSVSGIIHRDTSAPGSVTSFNNNLVRPSNRIALHPQLVHYNVQTNDGNNVGVNTINTIEPNESYIYQWYAGVVETPSAAPMSGNSHAMCPEFTEDLDAKYDMLSLFARLSKEEKGLPTKSPFKILTLDSLRETFYRFLDPQYIETGDVNGTVARITKLVLGTIGKDLISTVPRDPINPRIPNNDVITYVPTVKLEGITGINVDALSRLIEQDGSRRILAGGNNLVIDKQVARGVVANNMVGTDIIMDSEISNLITDLVASGEIDDSSRPTNVSSGKPTNDIARNDPIGERIEKSLGEIFAKGGDGVNIKQLLPYVDNVPLQASSAYFDPVANMDTFEKIKAEIEELGSILNGTFIQSPIAVVTYLKMLAAHIDNKDNSRLSILDTLDARLFKQLKPYLLQLSDQDLIENKKTRELIFSISGNLARKLALSKYYEVVHPDTYQWRTRFFENFDPKLNPEKIHLVRLSEACRYDAVEFGATNLTPPDRIKQGQKGAVGALIIEPRDSLWIETVDDTALDRQNLGNKRRTRATATVFYPTNKEWRFFRDLVMVHQKGLNLRYKDGSAVPNLAAEKEKAGEDPKRTAPEDAHDSGHMAINYGAEPMWFRFGLPPDAPFGKEGFGGVTNAWQAFSNQCCGNGGTAISADPGVGDPYVPVMKAYSGQEMRIRSLLPTGVGRASTMSLHGHAWPRDPYIAENKASIPDHGRAPFGSRPSHWGIPSKCIGQNALAMHLGGQESISPMAHFDFAFPRAGSSRNKHFVEGDFLWRDHTGFGITSGLWSIIWMKKLPIVPQAPKWLRSNC